MTYRNSSAPEASARFDWVTNDADRARMRAVDQTLTERLRSRERDLRRADMRRQAHRFLPWALREVHTAQQLRDEAWSALVAHRHQPSEATPSELGVRETLPRVTQAVLSRHPGVRIIVLRVHPTVHAATSARDFPTTLTQGRLLRLRADPRLELDLASAGTTEQSRVFTTRVLPDALVALPNAHPFYTQLRAEGLSMQEACEVTSDCLAS